MLMSEIRKRATRPFSRQRVSSDRIKIYVRAAPKFDLDQRFAGRLVLRWRLTKPNRSRVFHILRFIKLGGKPWLKKLQTELPNQ